MIATVTMNPAVDKLYCVDQFLSSEVNRVSHHINSAGGKGLNVSRVATLLGAKVIATGILGGYSGAFISNELKKQNIEDAFVKTQHETRTCINVLDRSTRKHTELLESGEPQNAEDLQAFMETYKQVIQSAGLVTISGSAPQNVSATYYFDLIHMAKQMGKTVLLDCSGEQLRNALLAKPDLIKPNEDEIKVLLAGRVYKNLEDAAVCLHKSGIPIVVISLGKKGALMACADGLFRGYPADVAVKNTVGCGDSMIAGFAVGLESGADAQQAFRVALAVSSASAMCEETGSFIRSDYDAIYDDILIEKIAP